MRHFCFLCEKEFQVIGAISLAMKYEGDNETSIDLYTSSLMTNLETIINKLKTTGLFDNIYIFDIPEFKYKGKYHFLYKLFIRLRGIFFPSSHIKSITHNSVNLKDKSYDKIVTENLNHVAVPIVLCSNCETVMIDDGVGSRVGDRFLCGYSANEWKLVNLVYRNRLHPKALNPDTIYLHNKEISSISWEKNLLNFPYSFKDEKYISILKDVFSYNVADNYNKQKIIYLGQWNFCNISDEEFFEITKHLLSGLSKDTLMRPHPLEFSYYSEISNLTMDREYNLWELICYDYINDDNILISAFSSSMCMPKILCNREPTIIFTYPVFENDSFMNDTAEKTYNLMYNAYSDKSKVIRIRSKDELDRIIKKLD